MALHAASVGPRHDSSVPQTTLKQTLTPVATPGASNLRHPGEDDTHMCTTHDPPGGLCNMGDVRQPEPIHALSLSLSLSLLAREEWHKRPEAAAHDAPSSDLLALLGVRVGRSMLCMARKPTQPSLPRRGRGGVSPCRGAAGHRPAARCGCGDALAGRLAMRRRCALPGATGGP